MKKYRYVEFTDGGLKPSMKQGRLFIVAENPHDYVEEFSLNKSTIGYYTTMENIGNLGWELAFVTPCGWFSANQMSTLQNAYVFKKEIEE